MIPPRLRATILALYRRGLAVAEIARTAGVATSTVTRAARAAGLARRHPASPTVEWRIRLPRALSLAADRAARTHSLSRSLWLESVIRRVLDAESRGGDA